MTLVACACWIWEEGDCGEDVMVSVDGQEKDIEGMLRILVDKQEIHEALMRYCRGVDRGDERLTLSVFDEGARDNHHGVEESRI